MIEAPTSLTEEQKIILLDSRPMVKKWITDAPDELKEKVYTMALACCYYQFRYLFFLNWLRSIGMVE